MTVVQISKVQAKRGPKESLPYELAEGEFGLTTDTGELFIGAPNLPAVQHRYPSVGTAGSIFPYHNIKVLTEFDLYKTLDDHVYTTGPLQRIIVSESEPSLIQVVFSYNGVSPIPVDGSGHTTQRIFTLVSNGGDLRGRVPERCKYVRSSDGEEFTVPPAAYSIIHDTGASGDSKLVVNLDLIPLDGIVAADTFYINFYDSVDLYEYDLAENDAFVINYSMKSTFADPSGLIPKRIGTLRVIADQFTVGIQDEGLTINSIPNVNYMNVVFAGHIAAGKVILTCTNLSHHPVSITFNGTRWLNA